MWVALTGDPHFYLGIGMFTIENGTIIWGDCKYSLPDELLKKEVKSVFGTSTAGLNEEVGILQTVNGSSGSVRAGPQRLIGGHIIDKVNVGDFVYLREQLDVESLNSFWLISKNRIKNQLNWISIEFVDGTIFRLCPFTKYYKVIE